MLKRTLLSIQLFLFSTAASAQPVAVYPGINWLIASQNADKSWGGSATASVNSYNATVEAVSALGLWGNTGVPYTDGIGWLDAQSVSTVDFTAGKLIARANGGLAIATELNQLLSWRNTEWCWGQDGDYLNAINDTSLTLFALKSANYSDTTVISNAINYLINNQNTDGGWGFSAGDSSNIYMTALVLDALAQFKTTYDLQTPINNAVSYLLTNQNPDGGFGSSSSTVYETALAFEALVSSGQGTALPLQNAITYLTNTQLPDGSWNDDPYSTALALRALAYVRPNVAISSTDITFSNPMPQVGAGVTLTANIRNTGLEAASDITVRFFLGDPASGGTQLGTDVRLLIYKKSLDHMERLA